MRRLLFLGFLSSIAACGNSGGTGPPSGFGGNVGTGGGGIGGVGGVSSAGQGGMSTGGSTAGSGGGGAPQGGAGGGASTGGGAGAGGTSSVVLGPNCPTGKAADVWKKLAGTYTLKAGIPGGSTATYFKQGQTYKFDVDAKTCSLVYYHDSGQFSCTWDGSKWDLASETVPGKTLTIHIQGPIDNSTENNCEFDYRIDTDQVAYATLGLPGESTGVAFVP